MTVHFTLNSHLGSEAASLETQTDIALHDFGVDEEHRGPMHATDYETFSFFLPKEHPEKAG